MEGKKKIDSKWTGTVNCELRIKEKPRTLADAFHSSIPPSLERTTSKFQRRVGRFDKNTDTEDGAAFRRYQRPPGEIDWKEGLIQSFGELGSRKGFILDV